MGVGVTVGATVGAAVGVGVDVGAVAAVGASVGTGTEVVVSVGTGVPAGSTDEAAEPQAPIDAIVSENISTRITILFLFICHILSMINSAEPSSSELCSS